jgi:hypothetical protein
MIARTSDPNHTAFKNYGGRGIAVCETWNTFEAFSSDMKAGFQVDLELERIDMNGNYEPSNCKWATRQEQQRNRRNNHRLSFQGKNLTVQEWGECLGIKPNTIITRLQRGWSAERALEIANAQ